ncbi:tyrosine-protein phosphatase [Antrihabitans cavernicola]|nr:tyrosine-protein phosphatase [Spelaeibacter cavernicola]
MLKQSQQGFNCRTPYGSVDSTHGRFRYPLIRCSAKALRELTGCEDFTVFDLRTDFEREVHPAHRVATMRYEKATVESRRVTLGPEVENSDFRENTDAFQYAAMYCEMVPRAIDVASNVLAAMLSEKTEGVIICCTAGKDRTGVVAAILMTALGVSQRWIVDDYHASEAALVPMEAFRSRRWGLTKDYPDYLRRVRCNPLAIQAVLNDHRLNGAVLMTMLGERGLTRDWKSMVQQLAWDRVLTADRDGPR